MKKPIEERSNKEVAKSVITPKRRYFAPLSGETLEAKDAVEAAELIIKAKKDKEVGDGSI